MPISGSLVYAKYDWEANYGVETAWANPKVFGLGVEVERATTNNMTKLNSIGAKNTEAVASGKWAGTLTVSGTLSNPWWNKMFFGTPVDAGAAPTTHTYTEAVGDAAPPVTFSTGIGYDLTAGGAGADMNIACLGCACTSATLEATQGEPAKLTLNVDYIDEARDAVLGVAAADTGYGAPFIFAHGTVNVGGALVGVQRVSFEINQNLEHMYALSSREGQAVYGKKREYNFSIDIATEDETWVEHQYGQAASPLMTDNVPAAGNISLTFTNGLAGANLRSVVYTLTNLYVNEDNHAIRPDDLLADSITGYALGLTSVVASDNTAVAL